MSRPDNIRLRWHRSFARTSNRDPSSLVERVFEAIEPREGQATKTPVNHAFHDLSPGSPDPRVRKAVQARSSVPGQKSRAGFEAPLDHRGHNSGNLETTVCEQIALHAGDGSPAAPGNQLAAAATPTEREKV